MRISHEHLIWTTPLPTHLRHLNSSGETCSTAPTESEKGHTMPSSQLLPVLNYESAAWGPYLTKYIDSLEKVQRRGARYVCNNYWGRTPGCVTGMIRDLGWQSLQERREDHRLTLLYKIQNNLLNIDPEHILKREDTRTRGRSRLQQSAVISTVCNNSFYPRTTRQRNQLPVFVTDATSLEGFKAALTNHRASPLRTP